MLGDHTVNASIKTLFIKQNMTLKTAHCMASSRGWKGPFGLFGLFCLNFLVLLVTAVVNIEAEGPSATSLMEERQSFCSSFFKLFSFFARQTCFQLDKTDLVLASTSSQSIFDALGLVCIASI